MLPLIHINFRDARPIYQQVKEGFCRLILSGALPPGYRLPSVRELASSLAINPNTIQRAYRELEQQIPHHGGALGLDDALQLGA